MDNTQNSMRTVPFRIVWLNGMPRSGTNWLSQIFDSNEDVNFKLAPLFSYAFKNAVNKTSPREEWLKFFNEVYHSSDPFINQQQKRDSGNFPVFAKKKQAPGFLVIKDTRNHHLVPYLLELLDAIQFIHIVRNPCGAISSWLKNPREFPAGADPMTEWKSGKCRKKSEDEFWGFDDWKLLTMMYLDLQRKYPDKVKVISYEELVENPVDLARDMFDFCGLAFSEETRKFIAASQSTHSENDFAVFKDKSVKDKWKRELDPKIIEEIRADIAGTEMEEYLYK